MPSYKVVEYSSTGYYAIIDSKTNQYVRKSGEILIRTTLATANRLKDKLERNVKR
jgi:hypothetical protein